MATAYIEVPQAWGAARIIHVACQRAGYLVTDERIIGRGERRLLLSAGKGPPPLGESRRG
jgi:hypothetical protein